jgi:hypothetical protein
LGLLALPRSDADPSDRAIASLERLRLVGAGQKDGARTHKTKERADIHAQRRQQGSFRRDTTPSSAGFSEPGSRTRAMSLASDAHAMASASFNFPLDVQRPGYQARSSS